MVIGRGGDVRSQKRSAQTNQSYQGMNLPSSHPAIRPSTAPVIVQGSEVKSPSKIAPQAAPTKLQTRTLSFCIMRTAV